ncbi:hypothetical protein DICPUDRAFT_149984 [Dictyostelium purpureum]|uniref:Endonuclease/exonuclease/phosphatase domain-containing protein n=1 Tax=Dictyostelium purpureum TaxID=5786 RepID=F0ZF58_DICPU|nr:uncharacterized protein DICPUDRAFT_149984 [Dictyostelium purpureum]EGC37417.1 hypothetical protein DICPUDRAFT_149984 [Dictyostelium purpureum]|eukprot:XP_003286070.1 hypothetical protein DICPUDRAFT_149984 [Dictyostelium purpureum]
MTIALKTNDENLIKQTEHGILNPSEGGMKPTLHHIKHFGQYTNFFIMYPDNYDPITKMVIGEDMSSSRISYRNVIVTVRSSNVTNAVLNDTVQTSTSNTQKPAPIANPIDHQKNHIPSGDSNSSSIQLKVRAILDSPKTPTFSSIHNQNKSPLALMIIANFAKPVENNNPQISVGSTPIEANKESQQKPTNTIRLLAIQSLYNNTNINNSIPLQIIIGDFNCADYKEVLNHPDKNLKEESLSLLIESLVNLNNLHDVDYKLTRNTFSHRNGSGDKRLDRIYIDKRLINPSSQNLEIRYTSYSDHKILSTTINLAFNDALKDPSTISDSFKQGPAITLPIKGDPLLIKNRRPITLTNSLYKIFAKVLNTVPRLYI